MYRRRLLLLTLGTLLTACASTQPRANSTPTAEVAVIDEPAAPQATASATPSPINADPDPATNREESATVPSSAPAVDATALAEDGPVTATMAQLGIAGEAYATLGDPNAPLTVVEYSDFG